MSGRSRRFSLVLGGKKGTMRSKAKATTHSREGSDHNFAEGDLRRGIAAARLTELLERHKAVPFEQSV